MDQPQYNTLLDALAAIPDPRHARGKQLEWAFILGVIASALLSQQRSVAAMAQWAQEHAGSLVATFLLQRKRVPSEATLRRALRQVDIRHVEAHLARLRVRPPRNPTKARVLCYKAMLWMASMYVGRVRMGTAPCWCAWYIMVMHESWPNGRLRYTNIRAKRLCSYWQAAICGGWW
jgi:hypothetical protein